MENEEVVFALNGFELRLKRQAPNFSIQAVHQVSLRSYSCNIDDKTFQLELGQIHANPNHLLDHLKSLLESEQVNLQEADDNTMLVLSWKESEEKCQKINLYLEEESDKHLIKAKKKVIKRIKSHVLSDWLKVFRRKEKFAFFTTRYLEFEEALSENERYFPKISSCFKQITQLNIELRQDEPSILNGKKIKSFFSTLKSCISLQRLSILFEAINYCHLGQLRDTLVNLKFLESLSLSFEICWEMNDKEITIITKIIKNLKSLKHLSLALGNQIFSDRGYKNIIDSLRHSDQLASLYLELWRPRLIETRLQHLFLSLSNLRSFTDLSLRFSCMHSIWRDFGVNPFEPLGEMKQLRNLNLQFTISDPIYDKDVKDICTSLKNHPSLSSMTLNLFGCQNIGDLSIKNISQLLENNKNLANLSLDVQRCPKISNEAIKEINQSIKRLNLKGRNTTQEKKIEVKSSKSKVNKSSLFWFSALIWIVALFGVYSFIRG